MTSDQPVSAGEWRPFVGEYDKRFYEVRSPETGFVVQHLWPNAGRLQPTASNDPPFTAAMGLEFRPCTCGHKYGGCLPAPPTTGDAK